MIVNVDRKRCMGHAMCAALAPDVFDVDDLGFNEMGRFEIDDAQVDAVHRGMAACPERAIAVERNPSPAPGSGG